MSAIALGVIVLLGTLAGLSKPAGDSPLDLLQGDSYAPGQNEYITSAGTGNSIKAGSENATTTVTYLSTAATASSTLQGSLLGSDELILNVISTGSTSAATLIMALDVSDDAIDWFRVPEKTATSNALQTYAPVDTVHSWNVATSSGQVEARAQFKFLVDNVAKYYRVRFNTSGANQAIWAEAFPREVVPN